MWASSGITACYDAVGTRTFPTCCVQATGTLDERLIVLGERLPSV
jgi:hypothetical protein